MPGDQQAQLEQVLKQYAMPPVANIEALGNAGGFSGAQIWRVTCDDQVFCLRQWPESHPDDQQLDWMHRVLTHVAIQDCPFVPVPLRNRNLQPFTNLNGKRYEIAPWMQGAPTFADDPATEKLINAVEALARFHLGSAQVSLNFQPSASIARRVQQLAMAPNAIRNVAALSTKNQPAQLSRLQQLVAMTGAATATQLHGELQPFANQMLPVQPIIRDIWHDHILFTGDVVTGIVDYGAMQMDHISLDLSRMLGSFVGNQPDAWSTAIDHYSQFRPVPETDRQLIRVLDRTTTLLGSVNWLTWLLVENRQFDSMPQVLRRIDHLIDRWQ